MKIKLLWIKKITERHNINLFKVKTKVNHKLKKKSCFSNFIEFPFRSSKQTLKSKIKKKIKRFYLKISHIIEFHDLNVLVFKPHYFYGQLFWTYQC